MDHKKNILLLDKDKSIHYYLAVIRTWDVNFNLFHSYRISRSFKKVHYNKLKNIFLKFVNDLFFWMEIEKMIKNNIIDVSGNFVYKFVSDFQLGCLSRFFFNIYLSEFDNYILKFSRGLVFRRIYLKRFKVSKKNKLSGYFPVQLEIFLKLLLGSCKIFYRDHIVL